MEHHQNISNFLKSMRFLLLHLLLLFFPNCISAASYNIPRLSPFFKTNLHKTYRTKSASVSSDDFKTYYYNQTLDHFNFAPGSYATFKQKYVVNSKYWGGSNSKSPIFAYLGAEDPLDEDLIFGFHTDNAPRFKALLVYIEHRFYGDSVPFGSMEEALDDDTTRGYFSSAQAIADYAEVLLHVKEQFSSPDSAVIVIGGSYGGMLASWFRLKYPHIALGALASSAPILYFDNITPQNGYYSIVTEDFKKESMSCYQTIRNSWSEIDKVASRRNGLSILSQRFKTCSHLSNSSELKDFLSLSYSYAAQYNAPPSYPVSMICRGIDGAPKGSDILGRIFAGVVAYWGNTTCIDTDYYNHPTETNIGWSWQTCSELVIPIGRGSNDTMFPASPFNMSAYVDDCKGLYGVPPRPHWVTTYYGGHDIKLILHRFASNIIFSNGLKDPYSSGGVLANISDSVLAVYTANGSHCLDILPAKKSDPQWLVKQRKIEVDIIEGWLAKYYADLLASRKG